MKKVKIKKESNGDFTIFIRKIKKGKIESIRISSEAYLQLHNYFTKSYTTALEHFRKQSVAAHLELDQKNKTLIQ